MKPKNVSWSVYLRNGIGQRAARIGERIGNDRLTYNPFVMRQFHDDAVLNAPPVISALRQTCPERGRFLDVGSGSGAFSAELMRTGVSVIALEQSSYGRALAAKQGVDCRNFDLTRDVPANVSESIDLAFCFEVAEHVPPALGDRLVRFMASFNTTIIFSAAQPGQGGTGHVNEQPCAYWVARFEKLDFSLDEALTRSLRSAFSENGAARWFRNNPFVMHPKV